MARETHARDNNIVRGVTSSRFVHTAGRTTKPLRAFFTKFSNDWSMTFAGALAYSLLTAILPMVIALVSILGFVLGSGNSTAILKQAAAVIPHFNPNDPAIQRSLQQLANSAGPLAIISVVLAIFGGSRLFITIESFLDIVYRVRPRTFMRQNLMAIGMMILFIILVPIMIFTSTIPPTILGFLQNFPALKNIPFFSLLANNAVTVTLVSFVAAFIPAFILFEAIYFVVPNQRISWHNSWRGALAAAIAMVLFLLVIFPFYSAHFMSNYVGQIGFAIVLLIFFYYFAVILMLGGEVNAFFFEHIRPLPNDLATFVSTMAGKLNRDLSPEEADPHVNSQPTDLADKAHIASVREQEEQTRQENTQKQQGIAARLLARDKAKTKETMARRKSSKGLTILEVITGSLLALVIELFRLRQRGK